MKPQVQSQGVKGESDNISKWGETIFIFFMFDNFFIII